jgi:hypothetical protein
MLARIDLGLDLESMIDWLIGVIYPFPFYFRHSVRDSLFFSFLLFCAEIHAFIHQPALSRPPINPPRPPPKNPLEHPVPLTHPLLLA